MNKCGACKTTKPSSLFVLNDTTFKTCHSCREYQKQYFKTNTLTPEQIDKRRVASKNSNQKKRLCVREHRQAQLLRT